MPWVARSPGLICHGVNLARAMISLVKGDGYEPRGVSPVFYLLQSVVPVIHGGESYGCHALLRLQSGVEKPQASYILGLRDKLIEAEHCGQDACDGIGLLRHRVGESWMGLFEGIGGRHGFSRA